MVTIDIAFETEKDWTMDMEFLQFVGISDHSLLLNRDAKNQHPIEAIEGLSEWLGSANAIFENISKNFQNIEDTFANLDDVLGEMNETLVDLKKFSIHIATENEIEEVLGNE